MYALTLSTLVMMMHVTIANSLDQDQADAGPDLALNYSFPRECFEIVIFSRRKKTDYKNIQNYPACRWLTLFGLNF